MFHLQKSSKSSDENLEINLLNDDDRHSRVNFLRAHLLNRRPDQNPTGNPIQLFLTNDILRKRKGSHDVRKPQNPRDSYSVASQHDIDQNYSTMAVIDAPIRASQSILTDSSANNSFIGFILFAILLLFTPLEIISFLYSTSGSVNPPTLPEEDPIMDWESALQLLLLSELVSFGILYYLNWIERVNIYKDLYRAYHRNRNNLQSGEAMHNRYAHPLNNPYILTAILTLTTIIFELSYVQAILEEPVPSYLVLFVTILPQITVTLLFQDELYFSSYWNVKGWYYLFNILLLTSCMFLTEGVYTLLTSLSLMLLIYLSIRVGRECMYVQYMIGRVLLLFFIILHDLWDSSDESIDGLPSMIIGFVFLTLSIIAVRSINNKILRNELYKYFYSDYNINCALLCIPIIIGLLDGFFSYVLTAGCLGLLAVCYKVGRDKSLVSMGF